MLASPFTTVSSTRVKSCVCSTRCTVVLTPWSSTVTSPTRRSVPVWLPVMNAVAVATPYAMAMPPPPMRSTLTTTATTTGTRRFRRGTGPAGTAADGRRLTPVGAVPGADGGADDRFGLAGRGLPGHVDERGHHTQERCGEPWTMLVQSVANSITTAATSSTMLASAPTSTTCPSRTRPRRGAAWAAAGGAATGGAAAGGTAAGGAAAGGAGAGGAETGGPAWRGVGAGPRLVGRRQPAGRRRVALQGRPPAPRQERHRAQPDLVAGGEPTGRREGRAVDAGAVRGAGVLDREAHAVAREHCVTSAHTGIPEDDVRRGIAADAPGPLGDRDALAGAASLDHEEDREGSGVWPGHRLCSFGPPRRMCGVVQRLPLRVPRGDRVGPERRSCRLPGGLNSRTVNGDPRSGSHRP